MSRIRKLAVAAIKELNMWKTRQAQWQHGMNEFSERCRLDVAKDQVCGSKGSVAENFQLKSHNFCLPGFGAR